MTAKEKAIELFNKFDFIYSYDGLDIMDEEFTKEDRKQCALIAVEEIIYQMYDKYEVVDYRYWNEVKHEIEKI